MKTDRLTLLISPADKAAINARAEAMGISVSELVRQAALGFDPEEVRDQEDLRTLLDEVNAIGDRLEAEREVYASKIAEREARRAYLSSDAYREEVRQSLLADKSIDWNRAGAAFRVGSGKIAA